MNELNTLSGTEVLTALRDGRASVTEVANSCLKRISEREPLIRAFAHHDSDQVRRAAARLDAEDTRGLLHGLPVGVKDLVDTESHPTSFGSPIYAGRRPDRDATVVQRLTAAGALLLGKTVTTEFALFHPGPTRNPHDLAHTPGGSSSGSAAATADDMVTAAIGTQTAGSIIRPASYCGVVGFKPTFGAIDRSGIKLISPSLDTVGIFARNVPDVMTVFRVVRDEVNPEPPSADNRSSASSRRIGLLRTTEWESADHDARDALEGLASQLASNGFDIVDTTLPPLFAELVNAQTTIMEVETAHSLQSEFHEHRGLLSDSAARLIERGAARPAAEYDRAIDVAVECRSLLSNIFGEVAGLLTLGATGEAPPGLAFTGDPVFCRVWTLLHTPAVSLPLMSSAAGLPLGAQIVGPPHRDVSLLHLAEEVMAVPLGT